MRDQCPNIQLSNFYFHIYKGHDIQCLFTEQNKFFFYCKRYFVDRVIVFQLFFLKEVCLIQALRSRTDLYRLCIEVWVCYVTTVHTWCIYVEYIFKKIIFISFLQFQIRMTNEIYTSICVGTRDWTRVLDKKIRALNHRSKLDWMWK